MAESGGAEVDVPLARVVIVMGTIFVLADLRPITKHLRTPAGLLEITGLGWRVGRLAMPDALDLGSDRDCCASLLWLVPSTP